MIFNAPNVSASKLLIGILATLLLVLSGFKSSQASDVVVFDLARVYAESEVGKAVNAHVEGQRKNLQAFISDLEAPLRAEEEQLLNQQALLAPQVFRERRRQFEAKSNQLRTDVRNMNQKIAELRDIGRRQIAQELRTLLERKSTEMGFKVVINRSQALFVSPEVDITNIVISELNASITTVDLPPITVERIPQGSQP